jgi:transcriptional regulator with XRE-family HTH domain
MGERIRALRKRKGLSQEALARAADVTLNAVQKWEKGERVPNLNRAVALARALGVTVGQLAGEEPLPAQGKGRKGGQS